MTFLSIQDTSLTGRTCHLCLQVAYHRTPKKDLLFVIEIGTRRSPGVAGFDVFILGPAADSDTLSVNDGLERVRCMLGSPWKRHFNKFDLTYFGPISKTDEIFVLLCDGIGEMKELRIQSMKYLQPQELMWPLTPLLRYESTLTRLKFRGVTLTRSQLQIIAKLSQLRTFEYLLPVSPHSWSLDQLQAFVTDNRLTNLIDFEFTVEEPLSRAHVEWLKLLPKEAIKKLMPFWGISITVDAVKEFHNFPYLRELQLQIVNDTNTSTSCYQVLCPVFPPSTTSPIAFDRSQI